MMMDELGDNYRVIKFLNEGAFGKAYLCEDRRTSDQCVVKAMNMRAAPDDVKKQAEKEVKLLSQLNHANIVKYRESFEDHENFCISMDYCEGGDLLQKMLAQQKTGLQFTEKQLMLWFVETCEAVKYLHGRGVVHRDIKPQNIFLTKDNSVRLGDFGVSAVIQYTAAYLQTRAGTVAYMAPEMCEEEEYTAKADIWSLGVTFYQLATFKLPPMRLIKLICDGKYKPISGYDTFHSLIEELLTVDPKERPSVTQVLQLPQVRNFSNPQRRLLNVYGYQINSSGQLCDHGGNRFQYAVYRSRFDNTQRYEGIAAALEEYLYQQMESLGLRRLPVPINVPGCTNPDFDNQGTFIFASGNWSTCKHLIILIHGSGRVKAGQWTRRLMINNSLDEGTQLPYIRKALGLGYGVVVLNTNDNKPVEGCQSPSKHGLYVWSKYIANAAATHIAIKAHSDGGIVTRAIMAKYHSAFQNRVYANAFTGVDGASYSDSYVNYAKKVTRNWVTSDKPIGSPVQVPGCDCECVSAGTTVHEETPHKAFQQVFDFIQERFEDSSPGNM